MVLSDWRPLSITHHLLLQLDVGLAVVLDVDVGFSPPVGVLRHFVQSDVVNQEVGVGVGTLNSDQGVAGFCKTDSRNVICRDAGFTLLVAVGSCVGCCCTRKAKRITHHFRHWNIFIWLNKMTA